MDIEKFVLIAPFTFCFLTLEDVMHVTSCSKAVSTGLGTSSVRNINVKALKSSALTISFVKLCLLKFRGLFSITLLEENYLRDPIVPEIPVEARFTGQVLEIRNSTVGASDILHLLSLCTNLKTIYLINLCTMGAPVLRTILFSCPALDVCVIEKSFLLRDLNLTGCTSFKKLVLTRCPRLFSITGAIVSETLDVSASGLSSHSLMVGHIDSDIVYIIELTYLLIRCFCMKGVSIDESKHFYYYSIILPESYRTPNKLS